MTKDDLKRAVNTLLDPVTTCRFSVLVDQDGHLFAVVVRPAPKDVARLIGSGGANFQAMKKMLEHAGDKHDAKVRYYVKDPDPGTQPARSAEPGKFDPEPVRAAAKAILGLAGYSTNVLCIEREGRHIITPADPLPYIFTQALDRWLSVCAKSLGGTVSLDADSLSA